MPNFDKVAVRITEVAARLAELVHRLGDELSSSISPKLITRVNIRNADIQEAADQIGVGSGERHRRFVRGLCRDATSGEKPSAMMGSTGIVCKSMPRLPISKMGPNTAGMSGAAATAAWRSWLSQAMSVPEVLGGGTGG